MNNEAETLSLEEKAHIHFEEGWMIPCSLLFKYGKNYVKLQLEGKKNI